MDDFYRLKSHVRFNPFHNRTRHYKINLHRPVYASMFFSRFIDSWSQSATNAVTVSSRESTLAILSGSRIWSSRTFNLKLVNEQNVFFIEWNWNVQRNHKLTCSIFPTYKQKMLLNQKQQQQKTHNKTVYDYVLMLSMVRAWVKIKS